MDLAPKDIQCFENIPSNSYSFHCHLKSFTTIAAMTPCKVLRRATLSLLLAAILQVFVLCNTQSSASGVVFLDDCSMCAKDEKCLEKDDGTKYCKQCAPEDCSILPTDLVCASNGQTYDNLCEMKKAACELDRVLRVEFQGTACPTLPPPVQAICKLQQDNFDLHKNNLYQNCDIANIYEKSNNGSLTLDDLNLEFCHRPHCVENKFIRRQCHRFAQEWCWCVDDNGTPSNFQKNLEVGTCTQTRNCYSNGQKWKHGASYPNPNSCGPCQCLDGEEKCYPELTFALINGVLNDTELERLQDELLRIFYIQYNHRQEDYQQLMEYLTDHSTYNVIRHDNDINVSLTLKENILNYKFDKHDKSQDDKLQSAEFFSLRNDLSEFLHCDAILNYIQDKITSTSVSQPSNQPFSISRKEFQQFFAAELFEDSIASSGVSKRDTEQVRERLTMKRLSHRNKFYYTLF